MNKVKLPTKTKIAVGWLIIVGVTMIIAWIVAWVADLKADDEVIAPFYWFLIPIAVGILYIYPGIFLCKKNKPAWISAVVILSIGLVLSISLISCFIYMDWNYMYYTDWIVYITSALLVLVPIILLILDRKNYFEMVRQRELAKKDSKKEKPEGNSP